MAKEAQRLANKLSRDQIKIKTDHIVKQFECFKLVQQIKEAAEKTRHVT